MENRKIEKIRKKLHGLIMLLHIGLNGYKIFHTEEKSFQVLDLYMAQIKSLFDGLYQFIHVFY